MKIFVKYFFLLILFTLLGSCASLPLPGSPTESLFILSGDVDRFLIDRKSENYQLVSVKMVLRNIETKESYDLIYHPGDDFVAIPVEPGKFSFDNQIVINFKRGSGTWTDHRSIAAPTYLIEPGILYICPAILEIEKRSIGEGAYYSFRFNRTINWTLKDRAMENILDQRRFLAWDLYPIIGWTPPEERDQEERLKAIPRFPFLFINGLTPQSTEATSSASSTGLTALNLL